MVDIFHTTMKCGRVCSDPFKMASTANQPSVPPSGSTINRPDWSDAVCVKKVLFHLWTGVRLCSWSCHPHTPPSKAPVAWLQTLTLWKSCWLSLTAVSQTRDPPSLKNRNFVSLFVCFVETSWLHITKATVGQKWPLGVIYHSGRV